MNKTIVITATVMFAVILGTSAMSPALAVKQATVELCHLGGQTTIDTADDIWTTLFVSSSGVGDKSPLTAHLKHGDYRIPQDSTEANCLNQIPGLT